MEQSRLTRRSRSPKGWQVCGQVLSGGTPEHPRTGPPPQALIGDSLSLCVMSGERDMQHALGAQAKHTSRHIDRLEHVVPVCEDACDCWLGQFRGFSMGRDHRCSIPSVPSFNVRSFSSRASICPASAALKSRSCRRCSSSVFFASIRIASTLAC